MNDQNGAQKKEIRTSIVVFAIIAAIVLAGILIWLFINGNLGGSDKSTTTSSTSVTTSSYVDEQYHGSNILYVIDLTLNSDQSFSLRIKNLSYGTIKNYIGSYEFLNENEIKFSFYSTGEIFKCSRTSVGGQGISLGGINSQFPVVYK